MRTIRIDTEAYRRLQHVRRKGESFSQTIKRVVHEPIDFEKWIASIEKDPLSDRAVEAVEAVVSARRTSGRKNSELSRLAKSQAELPFLAQRDPILKTNRH
jgi:predicted CopG family antitoxin